MSKYRAYSVYKESGVEWLGEVPEHWEVLSLKRISFLTNGATPSSGNADYWNGDIVWVTPSDLSKLKSKYINDSFKKITEEGLNSCGTSLIKRKSIVLSTRAPIGTVAISDIELCTNQGCKNITLENNTSDIFIYYRLVSSSDILNSLGKGTTFMELSNSDLGFYKIALPPVNEQQQIAAFLDNKTAHLDTLIEKKQQMIGLLNEKRIALITQAVTKGLDLSVLMKDSGVEWLKNVPEHWKAIRLSFLADKIGDGLHSTPEYINNSDYFFINGNNIINGKIVIKDATKQVSESEYIKYRNNLNDSTILLSINGTIGNVAFYENEKVILGKSAAYINCGIEITRNYLFYCLNSFKVFQYFSLELTGSTIKNLSLESIKNTPIALPTIDEQQKIVNYLDHETQKIDDMIKTVKQAITTLQEYRTALITAAVTGKIDVRTQTNPSAIDAFRGKGDGGTTTRLLADRQQNDENFE